MLSVARVGALLAAELMEAAAEEVPVREVVVTVPEVGARALVGKVAEEDSARLAPTVVAEVAGAFQQGR